MSKDALKVVLWVAFTALFFVIYLGVSYVISGSPNWSSAVLFFVVIGVLDKKGIGYLVDYHASRKEEGPDSFAG